MWINLKDRLTIHTHKAPFKGCVFLFQPENRNGII
jgi:hypothetical protein